MKGACPQQESLTQAIRGQLPKNEATWFEHHLDECRSCQEHLEQLAADQDYWEKASEHLPHSSVVQRNASNQFDLRDSITIQIAENRTTEANETLRSLLDAPSHPEMLGQVDQFQIEEEIGRGGCGIVFKGFDTRLNRTVAIKFLAPHLSTSGVARKRFEREARSVAAITHPNVVSIHNVSVSQERPYIVMNFIDGQSIDRFVKDNGFLDLKNAAQIAVQISSGLESAHRQGLIHRDIKPANIILCEGSSQAILTDFGLARAADEMALTQTGWLAGTPHYMSPEQARGEIVDQRSDLFSLGSVLYYMTTGREPFGGERPFAVMQSIGSDRHLPACSVNPDVSTTFSKIIDKLLEKDPIDRFQTAADVHHHLEGFLAHLNNPLANPKLPKLSTRQERRRRWQIVGGLLGLICLICFTWLSLNFFGETSPQRQQQEVTRKSNRSVDGASGQLSNQPTNQRPTILSDLEVLESLREVKTFEEIELELGNIEAEVQALESAFGN